MKRMYKMKDNSLTIIAKNKYEALYKASITLGRVVEWREIVMVFSYVVAPIRHALNELNHKGVFKPIR